MDRLERIEVHGHLRGVQTCEHRGRVDAADRAEQNRDGPMKSNGPSERLFVDDVDQDERESESLGESREIGKQAQETGFDENLLAHLPCGSAEKTEQAEFAAA